MKTYAASAQFIPGLSPDLVGDTPSTRQFTLIVSANTKADAYAVLVERGYHGLGAASAVRDLRVASEYHADVAALAAAGLLRSRDVLLCSSSLALGGVVRRTSKGFERIGRFERDDAAVPARKRFVSEA